MKKLAIAFMLAALPRVVLGQYCPNCVLLSAGAQTGSINVGTITARGSLTAGTITAGTITTPTLNVSNVTGSGAGLTNLNAAALASGNVSSSAVVGAYPGIAGVGVLTSGAYQAAIIGTQYGGTGQNFIGVSTGAIPYFSHTGTLGVVNSPAFYGVLVSPRQYAPEVWVSSPALQGYNFTDISLNSILPGNLPTDIAVNDASISTVSAVKIHGDISGGAAYLTSPLPISNLGGGTLPTSNAASSVTATGTSGGVCGGPQLLCSPNIHTDGRVYGWSQYTISIPTSTIPSDVAYTDRQNVFTSSQTFAASVTAAGFLGDGSGLTNLSTSAYVLPATVAKTNISNTFGSTQTFSAGAGFSNGLSILDSSAFSAPASTVTAAEFVGSGAGLTNIPQTCSTGAGGYSVLCGATNNVALGDYSAVSGGVSNAAYDTGDTVSGGHSNVVSSVGGPGTYATIGGGYGNTVNGDGGVVAGGSNNAVASRADNEPGGAISGGDGNAVTGQYSTIPGGKGNLASGGYSFAAGVGAAATHDGTFVWSSLGPSEYGPYFDHGAYTFNEHSVGGSFFDGGPVNISSGLVFTPATPNLGITWADGTVSTTAFSGSGSFRVTSVPVASTTSITVVHNLGYFPLVQVLDSSNSLIIPDTLTHDSLNQFTATFSPAFSGTILYSGIGSGGSSCSTDGVLTRFGSYCVNTFNASGTFTPPSGVVFVYTVVVGGGGGGAVAGGGAGGMIISPTYAIYGTVTVTVGAGGAPGVVTVYDGSNGSDSFFDILDAVGGGAGSSVTGVGNGHAGGSGGGASQGGGGAVGGAGTATQGHSGGNGPAWVPPYPNGGGGGFLTAGGNGSTAVAGNGGDGGPIFIGTTLAGGGGGGCFTAAGCALGLGGAGGGGAATVGGGTAGGANTGGGGGGTDYPNTGGAGGSGVVIVIYLP